MREYNISFIGKNPFFKLKPGWKFVLENTERTEREVVKVLDEVKKIKYGGRKILTRVVRERAYERELNTDPWVKVEVSYNWIAICDKTNDVVRFSVRETHQMGEFDAETCFNKSADIFIESEIELEHAHKLRAWALYKIKSGDFHKIKKMMLVK